MPEQKNTKPEERSPLYIRAIRKVIYLIRLSAQKTKHYLRQAYRKVRDKTLRHPYIAARRQKRTYKKILREYYEISPEKPDGTLSQIAIIMRGANNYPKSSAFIRLLSPLTSSLAKQKIALHIFDENTVVLPSDISVCIVQRTAFDTLGEAQQLTEHLHANSIRLIIDTDDAFSLLDESHNEHGVEADRYEALDYLMQQASEIWVSTSELAKAENKYTSKIIVVPNSLDKRIWPATLAVQSNSPKLQMVYMGTATHNDDLQMIMPALDKLYENYPDRFELTIIGISSHELSDRPWLKRLYQPWGKAIYPLFVNWLSKQSQFDIGLCPLVDKPFNRCKSDIKVLDYIALGILPVVSDIAAYSDSSQTSFVYRTQNTEEDWYATLAKITEHLQDFRSTATTKRKLAYEYLWNERSSDKVGALLINQLGLD